MQIIYLMAGGSHNSWLPLISPLVLIAVIIVAFDAIKKYIKKRRLIRENKLMNDAAMDSAPEQDIDTAL